MRSSKYTQYVLHVNKMQKRYLLHHMHKTHVAYEHLFEVLCDGFAHRQKQRSASEMRGLMKEVCWCEYRIMDKKEIAIMVNRLLQAQKQLYASRPITSLAHMHATITSSHLYWRSISFVPLIRGFHHYQSHAFLYAHLIEIKGRLYLNVYIHR